jgi:hypothetical protein
VTGSCKRGNELLGFHKAQKISGQLRTGRLLKKDAASYSE